MNIASKKQDPNTVAFLAILTVWFLTRLLLWLWYSPMEYMDTGTYKQLASQFAAFDFSAYNGQRTPIYPLMIALLNQNNNLIWFVQSLMGLGIGVFAYLILMLEKVDWRWSLFAALFSILALNALFFEPVIMTETISAFFLMGVLYYFLLTVKTGSGGKKVVVLGLLVGLLVLARPQFIVAIPIFALLFLIYAPQKRLKTTVIYLLIAIMPILGWGVFNKIHIGSFTMTTLTGYNLSNHSGAFMEKAPDEYAELRDIYLKYRAQKIEETGSHAMTIFIARHEMMQKTGMSEIELAKAFQTLSVTLFLAYPLDYMANVAKSWVSFWPVPNYWRLDHFENKTVANLLGFVWSIEHIIIRLMNVFFLLASVYLFWKIIKSNEQNRMPLLTPLTLVLIVLGISVLQALVEYGENSRYYIPNQTVVIVLFAYFMPAFLGGIRSKWGEKSIQLKRIEHEFK